MFRLVVVLEQVLFRSSIITENTFKWFLAQVLPDVVSHLPLVVHTIVTLVTYVPVARTGPGDSLTRAAVIQKEYLVLHQVLVTMLAYVNVMLIRI